MAEVCATETQMQTEGTTCDKAMTVVPKAQLDAHSSAEIAQQLYTPLVDWETRLLRLHPGTESDPLTGTLYVDVLLQEGLGVRELSNKPVSFEALWYTWGEPLFTHPIKLNGLDFTITGNLSEALLHLCRANEGRLLWIDALLH